MAKEANQKGDRRALGTAGETAAARYLKRRGYRILAANVRCRIGEIDLVAMRNGVTVFVEVKGNRGGGYGRPEEMVTPAKQRRLTRLALWYLQQRGWIGRPARFDVIAVDWEANGTVCLRHIPDAFPATGAW